MGRAIQYRNLRLWHIQQSCLIQQCRDADKVAQRTLARGQMIYCQQGVRLTTTEGGLKLGDRLAPFGIDLDQADFWQQGLDLIEAMLTQVEELH